MSAGRGTCPSCGSGKVTHILFGLPAGRERVPDWVGFGGCIMEPWPIDRKCADCGRSWPSGPLPSSPPDDPALLKHWLTRKLAAGEFPEL